MQMADEEDENNNIFYSSRPNSNTFLNLNTKNFQGSPLNVRFLETFRGPSCPLKVRHGCSSVGFHSSRSGSRNKLAYWRSW